MSDLSSMGSRATAIGVGGRSRPGVGRWSTVTIFLLVYALAYFDKRLITLLIDPIRHTIGATDVEMSVLSGTAFVSFYVLFSFPIGWATDRWSRRDIIVGGVIGWSVFAALGGFVRTFWQMLISRFGVGAGEAALMPAAHSILADLFPRETLARALGVFTLGAFLGSALSFAVGGALLAHFAHRSTVAVPLLGAMLPWQAVLLITSLPGLPIALLLLLVREPRRQPVRQRQADSDGRFMRRHAGFYASHFVAFSMISVMTAGFSTWLPTHLMRSFAEPVGRIGLLLAVFQLTIGPIGMLLVTRAVDLMFLRGRRDIHMTCYVWGALAMAASGMVVGLAPTARVAYLGVFLFDALQGGFLPIAGAILQLATVPGYRGRATAIFFVVYNVVGQALGPIAVAMFTDHLFARESMVGASIALTCLVAGPVAAMLLLAGRRPMRAALAEAQAA